MPHDPFQAPDLNDVHRRILDAVGFKVPASANLDDARDALEDHYLAMKRGPERDRLETAFTLMIYGDVVDGKPEGRTQSEIRALEQSGKTAHSRRQEMKKKSSERGAGSDGNYMTKQNLWLLHRMTELLYKGIPDGVLLPDWAESKINSAAEHIKAVAGWAMHESHGDDLHPAPEANPIHLAGEESAFTLSLPLVKNNEDQIWSFTSHFKRVADGAGMAGWEMTDVDTRRGRAYADIIMSGPTTGQPLPRLEKQLRSVIARAIESYPHGDSLFLSVEDGQLSSDYRARELNLRVL